MPNVSSIAAGQVAEYKEDITVDGSIGDDAQITMVNASLRVRGSVGNGVRITTRNILPPQQNIVRMGGMVVINSISAVPDVANLSIEGNVGQNVNISCAGSATITGSVDQNSHIQTGNGDIVTGNISERVVLRTGNGSIRCANMARTASVSTVNGAIRVESLADDARISSTNGAIVVNGNAGTHSRVTTVNGAVTVRGSLGARAEASTVNGNVDVGSASADATYTSTNGSVYVNGVRQAMPEREGQNFSNVVVGGRGVSIVSSGGSSAQTVYLPSGSFDLSFLSGLGSMINTAVSGAQRSVANAGTQASTGEVKHSEVKMDFRR